MKIWIRILLVLAAAVMVFILGHALASEQRGYTAFGGEAVLLVYVPVFYLAVSKSLPRKTKKKPIISRQKSCANVVELYPRSRCPRTGPYAQWQ